MSSLSTAALAAGFALLAAAAPAGELPPAFARTPSAVRAGDKVKIEFAVSRETDVSVFIEDSKGRVVRHLVAGVLGKTPPPPLKAGSLEQSVEWDGKADYGKPAAGGPFKVRVALGLGAKYDKVLAHDPQSLGNVKALAVGPDGTLYVCAGFGAHIPNWDGERVVAFGRDGKYQRTVLPWPSALPKDKVAGYGVIELDGRAVPLVHGIAERRFHSGDMPRKGSMTVTADGTILRLVRRGHSPNPSVSAISTDGSAPWAQEGAPALFKSERMVWGHRAGIAASSDGKWAYVAGVAAGKETPSAVYRARLPERAPAEPFFGEPGKPGAGETQLGAGPRGLAIDGQGLLYVADHANNRVVVVSEKDGKFVGALSVEKPDAVGADPATGAVYVTRLTGKSSVELVKYSGWKDGKELAKLPVPIEGNPEFPWVMALDAGAKPPLVWLGSDPGGLLRVEDRGASFESQRVSTNEFGDSAFVGIEVDRFRATPDVYVRGGRFPQFWLRYDEAAGKLEKVKIEAGTSCIVPGPGGVLYAPEWPHHLYRYDRNGQPRPWPEGNDGYPAEFLGKEDKMTKIPAGPKHGLFVPVSMTFMTHTIGVRGDGHFFVFDPGMVGDRPPKMLHEYTPDGRRVSKDPLVWKVSDAAIGPKFDAQGNIYVADQVKPLDQPHPPEFNAVVGKVELSKSYFGNAGDDDRDQVMTMYGSIVKFGPKGGMIDAAGRNPFKGEARLGPELKALPAATYHGYRLQPSKVVGAEWMRMGISHVDLFYCNCENTRFDVDEFGRVFYPDLGRFRVGVLDTAGNEITRFGGYGNSDSRGPESPDQRLAVPEIAFAWLVGVGVTDQYAYLGDSMNRRLLRAKLVYAAEETCPLP